MPLHAPVTFAFVVVDPDEDVVAPLLPPLEPPLDPPLDVDDAVVPLEDDVLPEEEEEVDDELESSSPPHDNVPVRKMTATLP